MVLQSSDDDHGGLNQSSQALLDKLDELLVDCVPLKEVENTHGVDYIAGLNELKKVACRSCSCNEINGAS